MYYVAKQLLTTKLFKLCKYVTKIIHSVISQLQNLLLPFAFNLLLMLNCKYLVLVT